MQDNQFRDATMLAQALKDGELTPVAAVHYAITIVKDNNDDLNAVTYLREEEALQEAETLTDFSAPFAGVPILLKDLRHDMAGLPVTSGSKIFKEQVADRTNHFVQSLLDAGFIVIGQTNVPEMGFVTVTNSELFGPAYNPINPDYSPGGSSGGAAAAIQSGMVLIASASDGGGSIRIPASYTGLIGLKPSRGRTPVGPGSWRSWGGAAVSFALTQSIRDTQSLLLTMQTDQIANPFMIAPVTELEIFDAKQNIMNLRLVYSITSPIGVDISDEAKTAVMNTVNFLEEKGLLVEEATPAINGRQLFDDYYVINSVETALTFRQIEESLGRSITPNDVELQSWVVGQYGKRQSGMDYSAALAAWDRAAETMMTFHQDYDIFIQPTTTGHAPRIDKVYHDESLLKRMHQADQLSDHDLKVLYWDMFYEGLADAHFSQLANMTGAPAISLPLHTCQNGLPLGVQLTAPKGREDWLLALGEFFESHQQLKYYN